jgi:hypothetical protein
VEPLLRATIQWALKVKLVQTCSNLSREVASTQTLIIIGVSKVQIYLMKNTNLYNFCTQIHWLRIHKNIFWW